MNGTGNVGAWPPDPPRTPAPPRPQEPPELLTTPARSEDKRTLVLKVSRRMLWVGTAALPLHNITSVDAFKARTDWGKACMRFLTGLFGALLLFAWLNRAGDGGDHLGALLIVVVIAAAGFAFKDVFRPRPVLTIETASGSRVTLTLPSMDELQQIAERIAQAIDNPEAEFKTLVQQLNSNNTNNYGPVVHMNGGRGNTGFRL
ncbi:DUF6232 family protein [Streptomyces sp. NPDC001761]